MRSANFPYLEHPRPIAFAHRGGNQVAPENSVAAFEHALSVGYRYLETDVHATSDGVLVAAHDASLDRVANAQMEIADLTWSEVAAVDLGGGHRIPTMAELFSTFPHARFNIDPKADAAVDLLGDAIRDADAVSRVGVGGFDDARTRRLQERFGPELCTSPGPLELLAFANLEGPPPPDTFARHGCIQVPRRFGQYEITAEIIDQAHDLGLQVHLWTINEEAEMHECLDLGADALITDEVELLKRVLVERGVWA